MANLGIDFEDNIGVWRTGHDEPLDSIADADMIDQFKNSSMVRLLVDFKANKELKCKQDKTAFEYAVFSNNEEIISILK